MSKPSDDEVLTGYLQRAVTALEDIADAVASCVDPVVDPDGPVAEAAVVRAAPTTGFLLDPLIVDLRDAAMIVVKCFNAGVVPNEGEAAFAMQTITRWAIAAEQTVPQDLASVPPQSFDTVPGDAGVVDGHEGAQ